MFIDYLRLVNFSGDNRASGISDITRALKLLASVPAHVVDQRSIRERKFGTGRLLRATLPQDRTPVFYRKTHVLSGWLADHSPTR